MARKELNCLLCASVVKTEANVIRVICGRCSCYLSSATADQVENLYHKATKQGLHEVADFLKSQIGKKGLGNL